MSGTGTKICGLIFIITSIFLLLGGLYLPAAVFSVWVLRLLDIAGLFLLVIGILMYKVLKR
ncbi:MAG: hypothetical protein ACTTJ7_03835 [Treponema sp.]